MTDRGIVRLPWNRRKFFDPEGVWWNFTPSTDALSLPGTDPSARDFDPALNGNDFTVAGWIRPDSIALAWQAIFGKYSSATDKRCWIAMIEDADFRLLVSKDGTATGGSISSVTLASSISAGVLAFFCGRYEYLTDGTSEMFLRVDDATDSITNAVGPVYSSTATDVEIADADFVGDGHYDGIIYWLAYWNRKLSDKEVLQLRTQAKKPWDIPGVRYWAAQKAVAATYALEIGGNIFDVEGTPVRQTGGSPVEFTVPSLPYLGIPRITVTQDEIGAPLASVKELGLVQIPTEALMGVPVPSLLKPLNVSLASETLVKEVRSGRRLLGQAAMQKGMKRG